MPVTEPAAYQRPEIYIMNDRKVMKLASRGKRFGAGITDLIVPFFSYVMLLGIMVNNGIDPYALYNNYSAEYAYEIANRLDRPSMTIMSFISFTLIIYLVVEMILFARGMSIGKAIFGLQVVSIKDGSAFGFWKMMLREVIVKRASAGFLLLGFIWILIDDKNRAWHDKILDSYVVDLRESERIRRGREAAYNEAVRRAMTDVSSTTDVNGDGEISGEIGNTPENK